MPSPFPGMDPYLEGPEWMTVHTALGVEIARQLTPLLPARYAARLNEWFVVTAADDANGGDGEAGGDPARVGPAACVYPDAYVAEVGPTPREGRGGEAGTAAAGSGDATATLDPPLRLATAMPEPVRHVTVEVIDAARRKVVSAIEVLSPANKRGDGRREYLRTRRRVLLGPAHLLEVDLLRSGRRVPMRDPLPDAPYFVLLSRADRRPISDVWPVRLDRPLLIVPVPLLAGDPDVPLDLQRALAGVYDAFGYARTIDYARPPRVQLDPAQAAWARDRLGIPRGGPA